MTPDVEYDKAKKSAQRRAYMRHLRDMIEDDAAHDVCEHGYVDTPARWSKKEKHAADQKVEDDLERKWDINEHGSKHAGSAFLQHLDEEHDAMLKSSKARDQARISQALRAWNEFEHSPLGQKLSTLNPQAVLKFKQDLTRGMP